MKAITYSATALKQLARIERTAALRIRAKLEQYAADPASLANQIKALEGIAALRLRVGDYRVIFTDNGVILMVIKVGHRRDIYR